MKAKSVTVFVVLCSCTTWELQMSGAIFKISDWGFLNVKLTKPSFQDRIKGGGSGSGPEMELSTNCLYTSRNWNKTEKWFILPFQWWQRVGAESIWPWSWGQWGWSGIRGGAEEIPDVPGTAGYLDLQIQSQKDQWKKVMKDLYSVGVIYGSLKEISLIVMCFSNIIMLLLE